MLDNIIKVDVLLDKYMYVMLWASKQGTTPHTLVCTMLGTGGGILSHSYILKNVKYCYFIKNRFLGIGNYLYKFGKG